MDIYCIRRKSRIMAIGDFSSVTDLSLDKFPPSRYILSSMITLDEENEIAKRVQKGIDKRIDYWIQEKRYVKRLIICALVFLIVYFLCSLVIRDPLPLVDEIIVSLAFSVLAWIMISKRDLQAKEARSLKERWKDNILASELTYTSFIDDIEEYFRKIEDISFKELPYMLLDDSLPLYDGEIDAGFISALDSYLDNSKKLEKRYIMQLNGGKSNPRKIAKSLLQDYSTGNLDLYFLAFYIGYSRKR